MLKLFNSLSKKVEDFKPLKPPVVKMYTCGPTVYQFAHIGNFRAFLTSDILVRTLRRNGYDVDFVMNITDVGHLTNDDMGGADTGEDKIEKTAMKEGKTAREVAEFYTEAFLKDFEALNMIMPNIMPKATDHIFEQIELVEKLQKKGFTYITNDGVYFDTSKFKNYGQLFGHHTEPDFAGSKTASGFARIEVNSEKRNSRDFALWKFSGVKSANSPHPDPLPEGEGINFSNRQMEWDSPWGVGFPGWHLECSAMSMKFFGEQLDIHTGGVDHREIHHPNEIAQSEGVTGKKFVNYWVHTAFMLVAGQKMSKSLGNTYTIYDLEKEGFSAPELRYLYLQTHYRQEMNFTYGALEGAQKAYKKLLNEIARMGIKYQVSSIKYQGGAGEFEERFMEAVNDDLNMAKALSVVWELVKSDVSEDEKVASIFKMDEVLGLDLQNGINKIVQEKQIVPQEVKDLIRERNAFRKGHRFNDADRVRKMIGELGFDIEDTEKGTKVRRK